MTEAKQQGSGVAEPKVKNRAAPSLIWLIPLITALIGGWLIVKTLSEQQGPTITLSFQTAEGIEAGKTLIKYKNVDFGVVESVSFSEDFRSVLLTAAMAVEAKPFLKRGTNFWVVRPRLSLRGVSGLGTLVSGAYIEMEPGEGSPQSQ